MALYEFFALKELISLSDKLFWTGITKKSENMLLFLLLRSQPCGYKNEFGFYARMPRTVAMGTISTRMIYLWIITHIFLLIPRILLLLLLRSTLLRYQEKGTE